MELSVEFGDNFGKYPLLVDLAVHVSQVHLKNIDDDLANLIGSQELLTIWQVLINPVE